MSRSIRMFEIIQLLRNAANPLTAQQIGDALEVSKRTAYRDIASLKAMRVPIDGEAGIGYIMRPGFDLPPIAFGSDEIEAIVVGLALLARTGDTGLQMAARRVAKKIDDVLPQESKGNFTRDSLHVSGWHAVPSSMIKLGPLRRAIREEEKLQLIYTDAEGNKSTRKILPLAMVYYIEAIIIAAWCELRSDFRHFRIDRMIECTPTGEYFSEEGSQLRQSLQEHHYLL